MNIPAVTILFTGTIPVSVALHKPAKIQDALTIQLYTALLFYPHRFTSLSRTIVSLPSYFINHNKRSQYATMPAMIFAHANHHSKDNRYF